MNTKIKFMKYRKIAGILSITIFLLSILSLGLRGLSLGLDFSGGTLIEVTYETSVELESIRNTLIENNYAESQVVNFGTNLDVLIKLLIKMETVVLAMKYSNCLMIKGLRES